MTARHLHGSLICTGLNVRLWPAAQTELTAPGVANARPPQGGYRLGLVVKGCYILVFDLIRVYIPSVPIFRHHDSS